MINIFTNKNEVSESSALKDIRKLSAIVDEKFKPFENSNYLKFHLTFCTRGFGKIKTPTYTLEDFVLDTFLSVESKTFRKFLSSKRNNLKRKIFLTFLKYAVIHSSDKFHKENHIHMLILMPKELLPEIESAYLNEIKKFNDRNKANGLNVKISGLFHYQIYSGNSFNFFKYCFRKNKNNENEAITDGYSCKIPRNILGKFVSGYTLADVTNFDSPFSFESLHLEYLDSLKKPPIRSLSDVRIELENIISNSLSNPNSKFTLIKSGVGTGKSHITNNLPNLNPKEKILVLVKRLENYQNYSNFAQIPPLPFELKQYFELHRDSGLNSYQIFEKIEPTTPKLKKLKEIYLAYKDKEEKIIRDNQFIVATHSKYLHGSLRNHKFDHVIFDECIVDSMMKETKISALEFEKFNRSNTILHKILVKKLTASDLNNPKVINVSNYVRSKIIKELNERNDIVSKNLSENKIVSDPICKILRLFLNKFSIQKCKSEYVAVTHPTFLNSKFMILSATASESIYNHLFTNELTIEKIQPPSIKAKIVQYSEFNISKHELDDPLIFDKAKKLLSEFTEKGYESISHKCLEPSSHFYATSSNNNLSGKDLFILSTPIPERNKFLLLLSVLGIENIDVKSYETLKYEEDIYKGRRIYYLKVSKNSIINEIFYSLIESELIQAIGRTRPFEHESHVVIYSNFLVEDFASIW